MTRKFSEYVSPGHPDKVADYISEYILDRYLEKDPNVRYAVEVMIKGNMVHLAGEVTSTVDFNDEQYVYFVSDALKKIGYTEEYWKKWGRKNVINPNFVTVKTDITKQSPEIGCGVDNDGWGDQGIFFGYADPDEEYMTPRSHSLAKDLCHMLYTQAKEEWIGGIDIKTEIILDEDGLIEKIIAAVPCRSDAEYEAVMNSIEYWLDNWYETVPSDVKPDGLYSPDIILLFAREMARKHAKEQNQPVKVSVACCIGRSEIDYVVETACGEEITDGKMNVTPKELIRQYGLNKPIFASMCTFGLFGKYQKDKKWEQ